MAARRISKHYTARIASIPLRLPTPPRALQYLEDDYRGGSPEPHERFTHAGGLRPWDTSRQFLESPEGVAHEFERSMLGDTTALSGTGSGHRSRGKGKEIVKRPASGAVSDTSSDFDVPEGPVSKRRKLEKVPSNGAEDAGRMVGGHRSSLQTLSQAQGATKGKGKAKQLQREHSQDSISTTPKASRKKAAPRRKLAGDLELDTGSHPPSVAGDLTPALSRPASPALPASTVIYDLDEQLPPLKKAKKIDDVAMVKRIKTLEETQRKVWTSIAKKDIAKVVLYALLFSPSLMSSSIRLTSSMHWGHKLDKHSLSVWPNLLPSKLANHSSKMQKPRRIHRPRPNGSCVKCKSFGRKMRRKREMYASGNTKKRWTE